VRAKSLAGRKKNQLALLAGKSEIERKQQAAMDPFSQEADAVAAENADFLSSINNEEFTNKKEGRKSTALLAMETDLDSSSAPALYGPNKCLSTYSKGGTCWIETHGCRWAAMRATNLGFTCVAANGNATQHYFGEGAANAFLQSSVLDPVREAVREDKVALGGDAYGDAMELDVEVNDSKGQLESGHLNLKLNTLVSGCALCRGTDDDWETKTADAQRSGGGGASNQSALKKQVAMLQSELKELRQVVTDRVVPKAEKLRAREAADKAALWGADMEGADGIESEQEVYEWH